MEQRVDGAPIPRNGRTYVIVTVTQDGKTFVGELHQDNASGRVLYVSGPASSDNEARQMCRAWLNSHVR